MLSPERRRLMESYAGPPPGPERQGSLGAAQPGRGGQDTDPGQDVIGGDRLHQLLVGLGLNTTEKKPKRPKKKKR